MSYDIPHRLDKKHLICFNDEIERRIRLLLKDDRERYKNRSHVVRVAVMRLYDETYEYRRNSLIKRVCKGIRERISRGNKNLQQHNEKSKDKKVL